MTVEAGKLETAEGSVEQAGDLAGSSPAANLEAENVGWEQGRGNNSREEEEPETTPKLETAGGSAEQSGDRADSSLALNSQAENVGWEQRSGNNSRGEEESETAATPSQAPASLLSEGELSGSGRERESGNGGGGRGGEGGNIGLMEGSLESTSSPGQEEKGRALYMITKERLRQELGISPASSRAQSLNTNRAASPFGRGTSNSHLKLSPVGSSPPQRSSPLGDHALELSADPPHLHTRVHMDNLSIARAGHVAGHVPHFAPKPNGAEGQQELKHVREAARNLRESLSALSAASMHGARAPSRPTPLLRAARY
eukprot:2649783-Rhodomonas_salina.3